MNPIVGRFVDAINRRDVGALAALLTPDHLFVDSLGNRIGGLDRIRAAWAGYFAMVPDYRITVDGWADRGNTVLLHGHAQGSYAPDGRLLPDRTFRVPAAWRAELAGEHLSLWQVYADNKAVYELMTRVPSA